MRLLSPLMMSVRLRTVGDHQQRCADGDHDRVYADGLTDHS